MGHKFIAWASMRDVETGASGNEEFSTCAGSALKERDVCTRQCMGRGHEPCWPSTDHRNAWARAHEDVDLSRYAGRNLHLGQTLPFAPSLHELAARLTGFKLELTDCLA